MSDQAVWYIVVYVFGVVSGAVAQFLLTLWFWRQP